MAEASNLQLKLVTLLGEKLSEGMTMPYRRVLKKDR